VFFNYTENLRFFLTEKPDCLELEMTEPHSDNYQVDRRGGGLTLNDVWNLLCGDDPVTERAMNWFLMATWSMGGGGTPGGMGGCLFMMGIGLVLPGMGPAI